MIRHSSLLSRMFRLSVIAGLLLFGNPVFAAGDMVPFPRIPKANGDNVHQGIDIRSEHMRQLLHQRDVTMQQGVRPKDERLQGCLSCHAVKDKDGHAVSVEDPKHFCRVCHDYTAVRIDCFECHASKPDDDIAAGASQ